MPTQPDSTLYIDDIEEDSEIWFMPIWEDTAGAIYENKAKGPYPKPTYEPESIGVIRATVRDTAWSNAKFKDQLNATNSSGWRGWGVEQAWIAKIQTKIVNEGGINMTRIRYTILCYEKGWKSIAPEIGYYYLASGNPKVFTDSSGNPYIGCLDGSGAKLASSSSIALTKRQYKRPISFSILGF